MDTHCLWPQLYMLHATLRNLAVTQRDVWEAPGSNVVIVNKSRDTRSVLTSVCVLIKEEVTVRTDEITHIVRPVWYNHNRAHLDFSQQ